MMLALGLVSSMTSVLPMVIAAAPAEAAGTQDGVQARLDNTVFAYVRAGESLAVEGSPGGSIGTVTSPDGTITTGSGTYGPATADGVWIVQLITQGSNQGYTWSVDVEANGAVIPGRSWTNIDRVRQAGGAGNAVDLNYWIVNDTGYVYEVGLYGYNGVNSEIQANSVGWADADCVPTYTSYEYETEGVGSNIPELPDCGETYRVFYEEPAADLPPSASSAEGAVTILPPVIGTSDLEVNDLAFAAAAPGSAAGVFTYSIDPRFTGGYQLQIDVDGNGSYDDDVDRVVRLGADGTGTYTYEFDGLDGNGDAIADCTPMNARIFFDKLGEVHIAQADVEGRSGGISITRLNGEGAPDSTIHWNDEGMPGTRATTTPALVGSNVDSSTGVHGWNYDTDGWGNARIIDDWAYLPADFSTGEIQIGGQCLSVAKTSNQTPETRVGDTVEYTVTATNSGALDYTEDSPAVVFDDLSGVLDDAIYNDNAVASQDGEVSYESPLLAWTGALPAGESVELTYSVTLTAGGDGNVRNVAFASECDPADEDCESSTPDCAADDPTCDEDEFLLPRLTIEKAADRTELPAIGESVEYTVTVTNEGPGVYTDAAPATFTDDLSDVIDAAIFDDNAAASSGEVSYDEPTLSWEGALEMGESATVTYSVTYTGEGDQNLLNLVCVPENEVLPGGEPCDFIRVPGADLEQWKQVESSDTPTEAGSVLTYTLFFKNDGEAAATVDAIDDLTHVLDDADVTAEPSSTDGLTATRDNERISITGTVPSEQTYSVSYQVTVKADDERGDNIAANFLMVNDPDNPPSAPPGPDCVPTQPQLPDCTTTEIPVISYSKSVEASETPVVEGTVLTYTVTAQNTGAGTGNVSREDVLTDVLDDADLTRTPESDTDSVTVSSVEDERFQIGGTLAAGETATITYEVTVRADGERGNNTANNFLVTPGEDPECEEGSAECTTTTMPLIESSKTVDPESGTTVLEGQEVTYTLTFTNSGTATGNVDHTDHLDGVLDDAELTAGPTASEAALTAELDGNELAVSGELEAGQTATVEYVVTVLPDGQRGDNELDNVLAPTGSNPDCGDDGVSCTQNPIPLLDSWKTVEADSTPVAAGTVLTYTLHFENTGAANAIVNKVDDLTHVLDDADVTTEPASDGLTVARAGNRIDITGEVAPGDTTTVTYQVTVREDGERGDDIAANFLLDSDEETPEPVCQPTDDERADCTVTPIGKLLTGKAVSADTDPIDVGTVLTYTLTFDNQGEGPVAVDHSDHLGDVLDDATMTELPAASDEALTVSDVVEEVFQVTGTLEAGQTATVTYQVTVNEEGERGNNSANNFLVEGDGEFGECLADDPNCTSTPLPLIEPSKTADPVSDGGVQAGEEVTYTLSFTNIGEATGPVDYTDHLDEVLDDAELTVAPASSDPALVPSSGADGMVRVTGSLAPGQTVTVSYTVTVKPDGERGDNELRNVVAKSDNDNRDCDTFGVECTNHPVGELSSWKTVDPASGVTLAPGAEATYTLHFENTGKAQVNVAKDDVLTQVLDDADVTVQPTASSGSLAVSDIADDRFTVTGSLDAGEKATVTYTVTVKPDGERGDDRLGNFLVATGEDPADGPCLPTDSERPDCTVNHVSNVEVAKSSDPDSGSELRDGDKVTYTLTFTNTSTNPDAAPTAIDYTDHMVDVLDDATLIDGPTSSSENVAAIVDGDTIRIAGDVPSGEVHSVSYTVQVKEYADQGDHHLGNVVAVTGEEPVCAPDSPLCTSHDTVDEPDLPITGSAIASAVAATLALIAGGALALTYRRRHHVTIE